MKHLSNEMDKKSLREFGFITGSIVAVLFGLLFPWVFSATYPLWPWYIFSIFVGIAIIFPTALSPVYKVWMSFGTVMGWINTRLILGLVFYLMFTPISLLFKLLGKDPMNRKLDANLQSYRIVSQSHPRERMEKPF